FLEEQLASIAAQSHPDWVLYWRDDGSTDRTVQLMERFMSGAGRGRCVTPQAPGRLGVTQSYMALLRAAAGHGRAALAFADQDDVWLPHKLSLGLAALARAPETIPALYCARQVLVSETLDRLGLSRRLRRSPGFPAALTQNVATGCTVMLNAAAGQLVRRSQVPASSLHDWWSYLLVAAAGGRLITDDEPVLLYRQHLGNCVGAPSSLTRRAIAALRRGPGVFMNVMRQHVQALSDQADLISEPARQQLAALSHALDAGRRQRFGALRMPGLYRQTRIETMLFRLWFMTG
ncbi:MAG: glycosyltransferase, partial [Acetobacteraceae bacterium]|nr:glycosyltransferase [Acetobacteraceae bacterium]